jgi:replication factor C subunit 3/5
MESLYIDKYVPYTEEQFVFNKDIINKINKLASLSDIPHIIINGNGGSGKKTVANYFIKSKYKKEEIIIKNQLYEIKHGTKKLNVLIKYSSYYWQLNPSLYGVYDRTIIQELILDVIQSRPLMNGVSHHIIIIEDADKLTIECQQCFRRILEKEITNCRFIFLVNQEASLIEALNSRCIQLRLSSPTYEEVNAILEFICENEKINTNLIRKDLTRNLKIEMNLLQIKANNLEYINNEELLIDSIVNDIEKSNINDFIEIMNTIRYKLYDLLVHCVEPIVIMKKIYRKLCYKSNCNYIKITEVLVKYENTIKVGSKAIYHLEAFILNLIKLI